MSTSRIALVTGGNRGIGLQICTDLARLGCTVLLGTRDLAKGEAAARNINTTQSHTRVHALQLDTTSDASMTRACADALARFGHIDILVNNAAVLIDEPQTLLDVPFEKVRETFEPNVFGVWRMCQLVVPGMVQRGYGRVVNVSSTMGQLSDMGTGTPAYRVSKVAVNGITALLAAEVRAANIKINCCCPGWVRTDMGGPHASLSVAEGADTPVWLATLDADGPTGGFFLARQRLDW